MYLYNISIIVENDHHEALINWVKNNWLPVLPSEAKFLKMLDTPHEGHTYCVQIIVPYATDIQEFQVGNLTSLQEYIGSNHAEKAFIFDSTMKYI